MAGAGCAAGAGACTGAGAWGVPSNTDGLCGAGAGACSTGAGACWTGAGACWIGAGACSTGAGECAGACAGWWITGAPAPPWLGRFPPAPSPP